MEHALLAAFVGLHVVLFLAIFAAASGQEAQVLHGFLPLSFRDSGRTLSGAVPYRDFLLEYPPGTLLFMMVPRLFARGYLEYRGLFFGEAAILDVVVVLALYASARTAGLPVLRVLGLYTLAMILIGPIAIYRLDLAPAALTALAVLAWQRQRPALAAAALAAGAATKLYPVLLLPPLIVDQWMLGRWRRAAASGLAFSITLVVFLSPALLALVVAPDGVFHALRFQTNRHVEVESVWALPPLLLHLLTGFSLQVAFRSRAYVILGPGDTLGLAATPVMALVVLAIYRQWWRARADADRRATVLFVGTAALVLAAVVLSKVLSPQYLIWFMPPLALLPLVPPDKRGSPGLVVAVLAFLAALPLTRWIYPLHFGELVRWLMPLAAGILAARNVLLLLALGLLLSALWRRNRRPRPDHAPGRTTP